MRWRRTVLFIMLLFAQALRAQNDSTIAPGYLCLSYNNDMFTLTDIYYTHGARVEFSHRLFSKLPTRHLLLRLKNSTRNNYGLTLVQDAFTSSSITRDFILNGDRPYAAYAYAGHFLVSVNERKRFMLTSELDAGVIGPLAQGYEVQAGFHKVIGDKRPEGWDYQVDNDIVINYSLKAEKELWMIPRIISFSGIAELNAGTLYDDASAGGIVRLGISDFPGYYPGREGQVYLFAKGQARLVGYNATLQGGMFNRECKYTVKSAWIKRDVYNAEAGVFFSYRGIGIHYSHIFTTRELTTAMPHKWGRVKLVFGF